MEGCDGEPVKLEEIKMMNGRKGRPRSRKKKWQKEQWEKKKHQQYIKWMHINKKKQKKNNKKYPLKVPCSFSLLANCLFSYLKLLDAFSKFKKRVLDIFDPVASRIKVEKKMFRNSTCRCAGRVQKMLIIVKYIIKYGRKVRWFAF